MRFDYQSFFNAHGVHYVTHGKNVKPGNINVHCPFCGADDPSEHLGCHSDSGAWGCWRNDAHRGRRPERLIVALLQCSWTAAEDIVKDQAIGQEVDLNDLLRRTSLLRADLPPTLEKVVPKVLTLPRGFTPITEGSRGCGYREHLIHQRGFKGDELAGVASKYRLGYTVFGEWSQRIIMPICDHGVRGWTGRAIGKAHLRYKAHPFGEALKLCLYNHDNAMDGGRVLCIVEGPFDAVKLDYYGERFGVRAVALMTTALTAGRAESIMKLSKRYDVVRVVLDRGAEAQALRIASELAVIGVRAVRLPFHVKDPGELTQTQVRDFCRDLLRTS